MNLLTAHLTRLFDVTGRENRQPFWLWILIVYITQTIVSVVVMVPLSFGMARSMAPLAQYDQGYLNEHPEMSTQVMMAAMGPLFRTIMALTAGLALLLALLIGAAVVRRLHDIDRTGWWALPPFLIQLVTLVFYLTLLPRFFTMIGALGPNPAPEAVNAAFASIVPLFALTWILGIVGFVFMVILIVFLATRGTIGPNRYGDDLLPPPFYQPPQQWQPAPPQGPPPPARMVSGNRSDRPPSG